MSHSTMLEASPARVAALAPRLALAAWAGAAVAVAASGGIGRTFFLAPLCLLGSTLAAIAAYRRIPAFRAAALGIDLRAIALLHAVRAPIGLAFLVETSAGRLPPLFGARAGWGDLLAGALALGVALAGPYVTPARRRLLFAWNALGLADIALAVGTANYLFLAARDPLFLEAVSRFPYGMLPTFVVPIVVSTHLLVFARLRREGAR